MDRLNTVVEGLRAAQGLRMEEHQRQSVLKTVAETLELMKWYQYPLEESHRKHLQEHCEMDHEDRFELE